MYFVFHFLCCQCCGGDIKDIKEYETSKSKLNQSNHANTNTTNTNTNTNINTSSNMTPLSKPLHRNTIDTDTARTHSSLAHGYTIHYMQSIHSPTDHNIQTPHSLHQLQQQQQQHPQQQPTFLQLQSQTTSSNTDGISYHSLKNPQPLNAARSQSTTVTSLKQTVLSNQMSSESGGIGGGGGSGGGGVSVSLGVGLGGLSNMSSDNNSHQTPQKPENITYAVTSPQPQTQIQTRQHTQSYTQQPAQQPAQQPPQQQQQQQQQQSQQQSRATTMKVNPRFIRKKHRRKNLSLMKEKNNNNNATFSHSVDFNAEKIANDIYNTQSIKQHSPNTIKQQQQQQQSFGEQSIDASTMIVYKGGGGGVRGGSVSVGGGVSAGGRAHSDITMKGIKDMDIGTTIEEEQGVFEEREAGGVGSGLISVGSIENTEKKRKISEDGLSIEMLTPPPMHVFSDDNIVYNATHNINNATNNTAHTVYSIVHSNTNITNDNNDNNNKNNNNVRVLNQMIWDDHSEFDALKFFMLNEYLFLKGTTDKSKSIIYNKNNHQSNQNQNKNKDKKLGKFEIENMNDMEEEETIEKKDTENDFE